MWKCGFKIRCQLMNISIFKGNFRWLSNFHLCEIEFEGLKYPSTEHAYQAAKFSSKEDRERVRNAEKPAIAKKMGAKAIVTQEWHAGRKQEVMYEICKYKFSKHADLRQKLLDTKGITLVEGNGWHDNEWGSCFCEACGSKGKNLLGKILMKIREELAEESP